MSALSELSTLRKQKGHATLSPSEKNDGKWQWFFLGPWFIGLILIALEPNTQSSSTLSNTKQTPSSKPS